MNGPGNAGLNLTALVVDDETPALDELRYLLQQDPRIGEVLTTDSATDGLRILQGGEVDVVFLDIQMPGLTGLELAQVLAQFREPPPIVFVTAHEGHAVEAFDVHAVDYVLKPVRAERLAEAIRRVAGVVEGGVAPAPTEREDAQIAVERGGVTRFVNRSDITHVEAQGDYARLHTADDSHLLRVPLTTLEEEWADAGFVRVHRSLLVALGHVREVRMDSGRCTVLVGEPPVELGVSRRHTRALRELLLQNRTVQHRPGP